ncbi:kinase-like domain-containing protein [Penicillium digitatum]|nr:hypothetical protein PDIDSM_2747 [Penicillium digitatum]QQK43627.1 kinase-like domain-containing protein [Penicillium digitatum]
MPPKDYHVGPRFPGLPDGDEDLSPEQQKQATNDNELASRSKYYEMSSLASNKSVYEALKLDRRLWEPFTCCQLFFHGSLAFIPGLGLTGPPGVTAPLMMTENECQKQYEQKVQYEYRLYLWDLVKSQLCIDRAGCVPNNRWEAT